MTRDRYASSADTHVGNPLLATPSRTRIQPGRTAWALNLPSFCIAASVSGACFLFFFGEDTDSSSVLKRAPFATHWHCLSRPIHSTTSWKCLARNLTHIRPRTSIEHRNAPSGTLHPWRNVQHPPPLLLYPALPNGRLRLPVRCPVNPVLRLPRCHGKTCRAWGIPPPPGSMRIRLGMGMAGTWVSPREGRLGVQGRAA